MAVNGIEIKRGQKWRRGQGAVVTVVSTDSEYSFSGHTYPVKVVDDKFGCDCYFTLDGVELICDEDPDNDLVELIEEAPEVEPAPAAIEAPSATYAPDLLDAAAGHMRDRAATYDKPEGERSMAQTVAVFNQFHGTALTEAQGWHFMQILKDVRLFANPTNPHRDSVEDGVAYSALKGEAILKGGV